MAEIMEYQMFIDGQWIPGTSGERMEVINPGNGEVVATVPRGNAADVDRALQSARSSFNSGIWRSKSIEERAQVLTTAAIMILAQKDRLAYLESLTSGATIKRSSTVDIASVAGSLIMSAAILREMPEVEHAICPPVIAPCIPILNVNQLGSARVLPPGTSP